MIRSLAVRLNSKCVFITCFIDLKNWCLHAAILLSPGNRFGTDWGYWVFSFKQKLWLCLIELLDNISQTDRTRHNLSGSLAAVKLLN